MREQQPLGITGLQQKLDRFDIALVKANRVSQDIGTPEFGRPELDISADTKLSGMQYLDAARRVGKVRKALAENAIPKLSNLRDQTQEQITVLKLEEIKELAQLGYIPDYALTRSQEALQIQVAQPAQQEIDDHQAQQKLDEISLVIRETDLNQHATQIMRLKKLGFTSAFVLARKAGISLHNENNHLLAIEAIQKTGIPIRPYEWQAYLGGKKHRGSILFARDEERVIKALVEEGFLIQVQKVQLVCGNYNGDYPSTSFVTSSEYESPKGLFKELGIKFRRQQKEGFLTFLTSDCPVPVFTYHKNYGYRKENRDALKAFLEKKAKELTVAK